MAHQGHNICWPALTNNLKYQRQNTYKDVPTDIIFSFKQNQGKDIVYFAESFARNLKAHTVTERRKYQETYEPPSPDDILIGDTTATKIQRTVYRYRTKQGYPPRNKVHMQKKLCRHGKDQECPCALPFRNRKASAFLEHHNDEDCNGDYYWSIGKTPDIFGNMELLRTLLLYGEMEPILRLCASPTADFARPKSPKYCRSCRAGLNDSDVYRRALDAYIALNIIYSFPPLWDPQSGCERQESLNPKHLELADEYRNTSLYQRMLYLRNTSQYNPTASYPHQQFFGIPEDHFQRDFWDKGGFLVSPKVAQTWPGFAKYIQSDGMKWKQRGTFLRYHEVPFGQVPLHVLVNASKPAPRLSSSNDVSDVYTILGSCGLPPELALDIMGLAGYDTAQRRLIVAHDPLHPRNQDAFRKYLTHCWLTLVRCNMFLKELQIDIN